MDKSPESNGLWQLPGGYRPVKLNPEFIEATRQLNASFAYMAQRLNEAFAPLIEAFARISEISGDSARHRPGDPEW